MLKICSIASGSSGNCYYIESKSVRLLVDLGVSGKKIINTLAEIRVPCEKINYVFLTHEHIDHVKSVGVMAKSLPFAEFFASRGTWEQIEEKKMPPERRNVISAGESMVIEDLEVSAFKLSHDAEEPLGYLFESGLASIAIVTDTGRIMGGCKKALQRAKMIVLESNYEHALLMASTRYPWNLKQRIKGELGHLSNEDACEIVAKLLEKEDSCLEQVMLAHLSEETNYPQLANAGMLAVFEEYGVSDGKIGLVVATRDERSPIITVK